MSISRIEITWDWGCHSRQTTVSLAWGVPGTQRQRPQPSNRVTGGFNERFWGYIPCPEASSMEGFYIAHWHIRCPASTKILFIFPRSQIEETPQICFAFWSHILLKPQKGTPISLREVRPKGTFYRTTSNRELVHSCTIFLCCLDGEIQMINAEVQV